MDGDEPAAPVIVPSTAGRRRLRPQSAAAVLSKSRSPQPEAASKKTGEFEHPVLQQGVRHSRSAKTSGVAGGSRTGSKSSTALPTVRETVQLVQHKPKIKRKHSQSMKKLEVLYGSSGLAPLAPIDRSSAVVLSGNGRSKRRSGKAKSLRSTKRAEGDLDALNRKSQQLATKAKASIHGTAVHEQPKRRPASAAPRLAADHAASTGALPKRSTAPRGTHSSALAQRQAGQSQVRPPAWDSTTGLEADLSRSAPFRKLHHTRPGSGKPSTLWKTTRTSSPLQQQNSARSDHGQSANEATAGLPPKSPHSASPPTRPRASSVAFEAAAHTRLTSNMSQAGMSRSRSAMSASSPGSSIGSGRLSPGGAFLAKRAAAQARDLQAHGIQQSHAASVQSLTDEVLASEPSLRRALLQLAKVSASCAAFGWSDTGVLLDAGTATGHRTGSKDTAGIEERGALEHTVDDFVALQQHVSNLQQNQYVRSLAVLRARLKQQVQQLASKAVANFQRRMAQELRRKPHAHVHLTKSGSLAVDGAVSRLHLLARSVERWDAQLEEAYAQWVADHRDEAIAAARSTRVQAEAGAEEEAAAAGARVAHMATVRMGGFLRSAQLAQVLDSRDDDVHPRKPANNNKASPVASTVPTPWGELQRKSASELPPPTPARGLLRHRSSLKMPTAKADGTAHVSRLAVQGDSLANDDHVDAGLGLGRRMGESASTRALRLHSVVLQDPASVQRVIVGGEDSDSSLVNSDSDVDIQGALDTPLPGEAVDSDSGEVAASRSAGAGVAPKNTRTRRQEGKRGLHSNTAEALIRSVKISEERTKIARRLGRERRRLLAAVPGRPEGGHGLSTRQERKHGQFAVDCHPDSSHGVTSYEPIAFGAGVPSGSDRPIWTGAMRDGSSSSSSGGEGGGEHSGSSDSEQGSFMQQQQQHKWSRPAVDTAWMQESHDAPARQRPDKAADPVQALYGHSQLRRTASMRKQLAAASIEADLDATPEEAAQALDLAHGTIAQVILDSHFSTISHAMTARRRWLAGKVQTQRKQHARATAAMQHSQTLLAHRAAFKREVGRTRLRLRHMFGHLLSPVGKEWKSALWQRDIHAATKASALLASLAPPAVLAVLRMVCHMLPAGLQWMVLSHSDMLARRPMRQASSDARMDTAAHSLPSVSLASHMTAQPSKLSTQPVGHRFAQDKSEAARGSAPAGRRVTLPGLAAAALITVHLRHSSHQLGGLSMLHAASDSAGGQAAHRPTPVRRAGPGKQGEVVDDTTREYASVRAMIVRCAATSLLLGYRHALRHPDSVPGLPAKFESAKNTLKHYLPDMTHGAAQAARGAGVSASGFDISHEDVSLALTVWAIANQASHQQHNTPLAVEYAHSVQRHPSEHSEDDLRHPLSAWLLPPPPEARQGAARPLVDTGLPPSDTPQASNHASHAHASTSLQSSALPPSVHKVQAPHKLSMRDVWDTEDAATLQHNKLQNATGSTSALSRYRADRIGVSVDRFLKRASAEANSAAGSLLRNGVPISSMQQMDARPISQAASRRHGAISNSRAERAARRGMSLPTAAHALLRVFRGHVARQYVWALRYVTDPSAIALAFVSADDNGNGVVEPSELASLLVMLGGYSAASVRRARAHAQVQGGAHAHHSGDMDWIINQGDTSAAAAPHGKASSLLVDMSKLAAAMGATRHRQGVTIEQFSAWWLQHVPHSSNVTDQLELVSAARSLYSRNVAVMQHWRQLVRACALAKENAAMATSTQRSGQS